MYTQTQVLDESFLDVPGSVITRVKVGILRSCDQDYEVFTGENCVGRSDVCDIVLKAPSVSGKHAIIEAEDFESLSIYDCNSRNKTILGKVKLKPNIRYNIQDGDEITFGDFVVTYIKVTESHASVNDDSSDTGSESMFYNTLVPDTPVGREITHEKMPGIVVAESPNTSIESEITGIEDKDIFASFCNLETPKVYRNINEKHFLEKQNFSKCLNENEGLSRRRTQMSDKFFTEFESRIIISKPKVQEVDNSSDDEIIPATQGKLGNNESFSDSKVIKEAEIQHDGTGLPTSEAISEILSFSEECLSSKETQNSAHTSKQEVVDNSAAKSDILEGKKGSSKISKLFSWQKNIDFNLKQSSEQTEIEECNKSSDPEGLTQVNLKINYTEDEKTGVNKSDQSNSCKVEEECNKSLSNPEGLTQVNLKINNTEDEKTEGNKSDQSNSCKVEEERNKSVCDPEDLTQVNFKINNTEGEKTGENISEQSSSCKFEEYNKNIIDPEALIQVNLKTSNTEGEKTGVNKSEQNNSCRVEEEHNKNTIDSEALTQVNFKINSTEDEKTGGNKSEQSNSCRVEEEYNKSVIEPEGLTQMNLKINSAKIEKIGINKSEQSNSCIVEDHNKTIADPLLVQLNMNTQVPITGTDKFNNVDTISQDPVFNMNTQVLITDTFKFNNAGTISHDPVFNMNTQVLITSTDKFNSADTISQDAVFNMDTQIPITNTDKFNSADIVSQDPTFNMNTQVPITDTEKFNIADTVSQDPIFNMVTQVPVLDSVNTSEASEDSKFSVDTQIPIQDIKDINIHFLNDFNKIKLSKIIEPKKKQQVNTSVVNASLSSSSSQETKYIPEVCIQKNNVLNSFENVIFKQCSKNKCEVQFGDNNIVTNSGTGKVLAQTDVNSKNVNGINHGNNKVEDSCVTETLTQVSLQKENRTDINIEDLDDDSTDIDEDLAKNKSLPVVTLKTSEVSVNTIYLSEENNQSESLKIVSEGIDENAEEENIFDGTKSIICKHSPCKASKKGNDSTKHSESGTSFSLAHSSNNNGNKDETEFSLASTCAFEEAVIPFEATYTLRKDASYSDEETEIEDKDKTVNSSQVGKSRLSKSTKKVSNV